MSRVARLGGNGYRSHRQLVGPLGKSWWHLVLDAAGETVAMCDCEESADMVALALNETRRTHVVLAGIGGIDETVKPDRLAPIPALSTVPDPAPTAPYLAEDEPPKEAG